MGADAEGGAEAPGSAPSTPGGAPPLRLAWLQQTYVTRWKGSLDVFTEPAEGSSIENPLWRATITAAGGVVPHHSTGLPTTLEPVVGVGQGRSKKAAEHAAAADIYDQLVALGWYDPNAPPPPVRPNTGSGRARRFLIDSTPCNTLNPWAYLDLQLAGQPVGRVVVELFRYKRGTTLDEHAPLAVSNFLALCHGADVAGRRLCFAGVPVTRLVKRYLLQTGDADAHDGSGSAHIHMAKGRHFPDEGLDDRSYRFQSPFMLGAANLGVEDSNGCQFLVTLAPAPHLAGTSTCFGKVLAGFGTLRQVEDAAADPSAPDGLPLLPITIAAAGELPPGSDLTAAGLKLPSRAGWPLWPEDAPLPPPGMREVEYRMDASAQLRAAGNEAYRSGDAAPALDLYAQALRYLQWSSFRLHTNGDVDMTPEDARAVWDAELVLLANRAAALLKLRRWREAAETSDDLLHRDPCSAKGLLRAAQARIGIGASEYSTAAGLLARALAAVREQGLPTADVLSEMRKLRELRRARSSRAIRAFSHAFAEGLLAADHADDEQPPASGSSAQLPGSSSTDMPLPPLRHVVLDPRTRVPGPVPLTHVLPSGAPVLVDDAWGRHLLVADGQGDSGDDEGPDTLRAGFGGSYRSGLTARMAQLLGDGMRGGAGTSSQLSSDPAVPGTSQQSHSAQHLAAATVTPGLPEQQQQQQQQQQQEQEQELFAQEAVQQQEEHEYGRVPRAVNPCSGARLDGAGASAGLQSCSSTDDTSVPTYGSAALAAMPQLRRL